MTVSTDELHELLLRLSGQVPDEAMTIARGQLARGNLTQFTRAVTAGVLEHNVVLDDEDLATLTRVGFDATVLSAVDGELEPPGEYGFTASHHDPLEDEGPEQVAVELVAAMDGVRGLWRTWRVRRNDESRLRARRVFVVEVDRDPLAVTGALQRELFDAGEPHPQVEAYVTGADLPPYQRLARANGQLLWARTPPRRIRMAALFDEVDPAHGPRFRHDHERVEDDTERLRLAGYLRAGQALLVSTALLSDIVDPDAGFTVPVSFRTDGLWLWTDATTYYLERHHLAPDPVLAAHIRERGYRHAQLDGVDLHRALAALRDAHGARPRWVFDGGAAA